MPISSAATLSWSVLSRCFAFQEATSPAVVATIAPAFTAFRPFELPLEPEGAARFAFIAAIRLTAVQVAQPIIAFRLLTMLIRTSSR